MRGYNLLVDSERLELLKEFLYGVRLCLLSEEYMGDFERFTEGDWLR
jgi:hypothetical protein